MPIPLSATAKDRITHHILSGLSNEAVANTEHVSLRTVYNICTNLKTYGSHTAPPLVKRGRPCLITAPMEAGLRVFLEAKPWSYQDEIVEYLFDHWDVLIDRSTLSKSLKRMKISRKRLQRIALERNETCRHAYQLQVSQYTADMLIYVDESAANEHTKDRKHGWSSFGVTPSIKRPVKRSERYSILPAYTIDGVIACHVHQGSITGQRFLWWLENEVLPQCGQFPAPKSVLILDNASIHHSQVGLLSSILIELIASRLYEIFVTTLVLLSSIYHLIRQITIQLRSSSQC